MTRQSIYIYDKNSKNVAVYWSYGIVYYRVLNMHA